MYIVAETSDHKALMMAVRMQNAKKVDSSVDFPPIKLNIEHGYGLKDEDILDDSEARAEEEAAKAEKAAKAAKPLNPEDFEFVETPYNPFDAIDLIHLYKCSQKLKEAIINAQYLEGHELINYVENWNTDLMLQAAETWPRKVPEKDVKNILIKIENTRKELAPSAPEITQKKDLKTGEMRGIPSEIGDQTQYEGITDSGPWFVGLFKCCYC